MTKWLYLSLPTNEQDEDERLHLQIGWLVVFSFLDLTRLDFGWKKIIQSLFHMWKRVFFLFNETHREWMRERKENKEFLKISQTFFWRWDVFQPIVIIIIINTSNTSGGNMYNEANFFDLSKRTCLVFSSFLWKIGQSVAK